jgi:hypothetical protein
MERRRSSRDHSDDSRDHKKDQKASDIAHEKQSAIENRVKVEVLDDDYVHKPLLSFDEADFPSAFYDVIDELGFKGPTPI